MAVDKIRQQRTPGQFGVEATSLSGVDVGAASYSRPGVVDTSKAVQYKGYANLAQNIGDIAAGAVKQGGEFYEGMQIAQVEKEHEANIQEYLDSKKNPQIVQDAPIELSALESQSAGLWNKLGEGADIADIDNIESQYKAKLETLKKAAKQGVMSQDEFSQRALAITRNAVNRNPALYQDIINHTKKVMNLTGMDDLLAAEQKGAESAQKAYDKTVEYHMSIAKAENIPVTYDSQGNVDLVSLKAQTDKVQQEKFAVEAMQRSETIYTQKDKDQARDFIAKFGTPLANGISNNTNAAIQRILADPNNKGEQTVKIRQVFDMAKKAWAEKAGPLRHHKEVKEVDDYFNKIMDANMAMYEKLTTREEQAKFANNIANITRDESYNRLAKIADPATIEMITKLYPVVAPDLAVRDSKKLGNLTDTLGNVLAGVSNGMSTDYTLKDGMNKNAISNAVNQVAKKSGEGDNTAKGKLDTMVETIYADSKTKFETTEDKYKFYDDYIRAIADPATTQGWATLSEGARDKASANFDEYMSLTLQGFKQDLGAIANKGTDIKLSKLPDGRLVIQTSNQVDTDLLNQKYGIRINNGVKAFANLIGSNTKAASDVMFEQYEALRGITPAGSTQDEKKKVNNFGNRPDGTPKGTGFLGIIQSNRGQSMTEYSVTVPINGKDTDIPTLIPGLTSEELNYIKGEGELKRGIPIADSIVGKAIKHAEGRIKSGKSPFAEDGKPNETNPLNLTIPGKVGKFQKFESTEEGIRAASAQLDRYFTGKTPGTEGGLNTLDKIGGKWNNENEAGSTSKKNYVATLVKHMGVGANEPLDLNNKDVKADLIYAMSVAEGRPLRPSLIMSALGK